MPTEILKVEASKQLFIIQADMLLHPRDIEKLKDRFAQDIKNGCLILPAGFSAILTQKNKGGNENADENK